MKHACIIVSILFFSLPSFGANITDEREDEALQNCPGFADFKQRSLREKETRKTDPTEPAKPTLPRARRMLLGLADMDQGLRRRSMANPNDKNLIRLIGLHDGRTTKRLKEFNGGRFPTARQVGTDGVNAAWLLVQHSRDHAFQERILDELRLDDSSTVGPDQLALLEDRVNVNEGKPQRFGSQFQQQGNRWVPLPIADESELDLLREKAHLMPFLVYQCVLTKIYGVPAAK